LLIAEIARGVKVCAPAEEADELYLTLHKACLNAVIEIVKK